MPAIEKLRRENIGGLGGGGYIRTFKKMNDSIMSILDIFSGLSGYKKILIFMDLARFPTDYVKYLTNHRGQLYFAHKYQCGNAGTFVALMTNAGISGGLFSAGSLRLINESNELFFWGMRLLTFRRKMTCRA